MKGHKVAAVIAVHEKYPQIADLTAPFVYARLQTASEKEKFGYSAKELDRVARAAHEWSAGKAPADRLSYVGEPAAGAAKSRDVFIYMIGAAKEKNPAAARALIERL